MKLLREKGWEINNIDAMVCLEAPKINPHIPAMQVNIARAAGIDADDISIKATTNEQLGFIGREEGIVAYAVCLIEKYLFVCLFCRFSCLVVCLFFSSVAV